MKEEISDIDKTLALSERQFLALIRLAIMGESSPVLDEDIDWAAIMDESMRQSVIGIVFAAIQQLPKDKLTDRRLMTKWYGTTEYIKDQNRKLNKKCVKMTKLFADMGYRSVILKGQSNYAYYHQPELRNSGDIDIWVDGDRDAMIKLAQTKWNTRHLQFHHIDCKVFAHADVELHFWPMTLFNYWNDRKLKRIFDEERKVSFENHFILDGEGDICILSPRANVMMQLVHVYHHLLFEGVGFRQLLDFYMLLKSIKDEATREQLRKDIKSCGLTKFAGAVSWVLQEIFYLEEEYIITPANRAEGQLLLSEIMEAGNFGHHDKRYNNLHRDSKVRNFLFITRQNFRLFTHYPSDCIWNIWYRICQFFWRMQYRK